ncbi:MAG: TFIIF-interacting CTD phosphatase-like protein, partial [Natronomonas sp.]
LEAHAEAAEPAETRDVSDLETLESDLEEKQAIVEAKQARMSAFQNLAAEYLELAETLDAEIDDWETALQRVVTFEREHDAPVYFDDRQTLYEAAAESDDTAE